MGEPLPPLSCDVLVIGGGIMGLLASKHHAERGDQVLCLRLSDAQRPEADTFRNQGWLQSGHRYYAKATTDEEKEAAWAMGASGRELLEFIGIPEDTIQLSDGPGLAAFPFRAQADEFVAFSEAALPAAASILSASQAERLSGPFWSPKFTWVETAEKSFREEKVVERLRAVAERAAVALREVAEPVRVEWRGEGRAVALVGQQEIAAQRIILAAGAGNVPLLASLGTPGFEVQVTPLLVVETSQPPDARVISLKGNLTAVRHDRDGRHFLVVGTPSPDGTSPGRYPLRTLGGDMQGGMRRFLPGALDVVSTRVTTGFELQPPRVPDHLPYVRALSEGSNVIVAHPGRATYAWRAGLIVRDMDEDNDDHADENDRGPRPAPVRPGPGLRDDHLPGVAWSGDSPVRMHFDPYYEAKGMDDAPAG